MENIYLKRGIEKAFKQIITEFPAVTVTGHVRPVKPL